MKTEQENKVTGYYAGNPEDLIDQHTNALIFRTPQLCTAETRAECIVRKRCPRTGGSFEGFKDCTKMTVTILMEVVDEDQKEKNKEESHVEFLKRANEYLASLPKEEAEAFKKMLLQPLKEIKKTIATMAEGKSMTNVKSRPSSPPPAPPKGQGGSQ